VKKNQDTALKVEYDGDFRICCCLKCCKRWYFTFNGVECSKPITIEAIDVIYTNHGRTDRNIHKHSQIGGYCEGIGKGTVRVGLVVGDYGLQVNDTSLQLSALGVNQRNTEQLTPTIQVNEALKRKEQNKAS